MQKAIILLYSLLFTYSCAGPQPDASTATETSERPPNILLLLADDLGYGELGCYGQEVIKTPVLDSLAGQGMLFTDFYAGNPVCAASRAVLLSGRSSGHNAVRGNKGLAEDGSWRRVALPPDHVTIAEMLRPRGYQTAMIGKWHLDVSYDLDTWAHSRGFDYSVQEQWSDKRDPGPRYDSPMEYINGLQDSVNYDLNQYDCQDEFRTDLALDYLDNKREADKPFFLFMSYRAPHGHEYEIGNKTLYAEHGWAEPERLHAAQITLLDREVGRLLNKLRELGELENTLVLFTSDNGPHTESGHHPEFFASNGQTQGYKRDVYEGGIRVPMLAYWAGRVPQGVVTDRVASGQDVLPTIAAAAGAKVPDGVDGISFLPVLLGEEQPLRDTLNWEFHKPGDNPRNFRQAARMGDFKAVRYGTNVAIEVYDLSKDIAEAYDIAAERPDLVARAERIFREERTATSAFPYGREVR
ncbi:sulfatase-like hydrolase/transferase [Neolewinella aurantiaca]|uniref:Sulfatase-like hydrolase/transferase n=1 Tax=Neolewinella aurantiaca TaxID=2602767 RepID=A0A5C7FPU3_9BACT|nr:sulfatase-like hydrolase/transferase [Neolewinella aurantiaca]TXF87962.1 sulfatase-like hydrolase/transferase [Neolewinella aurantiaca]